MKRVKLGKSNLEVSALAMGSDLIGSKIDRETAFKLFDFYSDNGGTFIDTANMYACWLPGCKGGESETTIGAWMKERRNRERDGHFLQAGIRLSGMRRWSERGRDRARMREESEETAGPIGSTCTMPIATIARRRWKKP